MDLMNGIKARWVPVELHRPPNSRLRNESVLPLHSVFSRQVEVRHADVVLMSDEELETLARCIAEYLDPANKAGHVGMFHELQNVTLRPIPVLGPMERLR